MSRPVVFFGHFVGIVSPLAQEIVGPLEPGDFGVTLDQGSAPGGDGNVGRFLESSFEFRDENLAFNSGIILPG